MQNGISLNETKAKPPPRCRHRAQKKHHLPVLRSFLLRSAKMLVITERSTYPANTHNKTRDMKYREEKTAIISEIHPVLRNK